MGQCWINTGSILVQYRSMPVHTGSILVNIWMPCITEAWPQWPQQTMEAGAGQPRPARLFRRMRPTGVPFFGRRPPTGHHAGHRARLCGSVMWSQTLSQSDMFVCQLLVLILVHEMATCVTTLVHNWVKHACSVDVVRVTSAN